MLLEAGMKTASCHSVNQSSQLLFSYFTGGIDGVCRSVKTSLVCLPRVSEIFFHVHLEMTISFNKGNT